jgi:hypothetical protein
VRKFLVFSCISTAKQAASGPEERYVKLLTGGFPRPRGPAARLCNELLRVTFFPR